MNNCVLYKMIINVLYEGMEYNYDGYIMTSVESGNKELDKWNRIMMDAIYGGSGWCRMIVDILALY